MATNDIRQHHTLVSWKAVFAGLFVSLITYASLFFLGVGIGGVTLVNAASDGIHGPTVTTMTVIWLVASTIISLIVGGYFAARVSNFVTERIGAAQGLVISGLFHTIMYVQMVIAAGAIGVGVTSLAGVAATNLDENPTVTSAIESAIGTNQLKSDMGTVSREITIRVLRGNTEAARSYLAYQLGSPAEVDQMINQIQTTAREATEATGKAIAGISWMMFLMIVLSSVGAVLGGSMGSKNNHRKPLDAGEVVPMSRYQSAT